MIDAGVNDLIKGTLNKSVDSVYENILEIALHCLNQDISKVFFQGLLIK